MGIKRHKKANGGQAAMVALSLFAFSTLFPEKVSAQNVSCPEPLIFGDVISCAGTGTVTVRPDGTRGTGGCVSTGGAPFAFARCLITQPFPTRPVQISLAAATANMTGPDTMPVNNFNLITNNGGASTTITSLFVSVPIGATLNLGANQAAGTYNGSFTINVNLQ